MKKNILFASIALILSVSTQAGGGGQETKKGDATVSTARNETLAWVPNKENRYTFKVVEGNESRTLTVSIHGIIRNESILSIINLKGEEQFRKVLKPIGSNFTMDISVLELSHGVYFLKVDSQDEIRMKPLVIR
jgi:hypothetical protein